MNEWGSKFWTTSEERIREITTFIEKELSGKAGIEVAQLLALQGGGKLTLSEQQVREVSRRGREIVSGVHMSHLSSLMDSFDEDILTDPKRRYYVIVDFLDEQWVADERLRVWLVRGLIETIRDFNRKVRYAKIIIALRLDLLRRVYRATSDSGFQEEKYDALNLTVSWRRQELERLLDERVQELVKQRYTKQSVRLKDILPARMDGRKGGGSGVDYLLDRTLLRPRDAIQFLNACLEVAVGEPQVTVKAFHEAEARYSQQRRTAIADEWSELYPYAVLLTDLLKGRGPQFKLGGISDDDLETMCLRLRELDDCDPRPGGKDVEMFDRFFHGSIGAAELRALLVQSFYTMGLVGVKLAHHLGTSWSSDGGPVSLNSAEIHDDIVVHVHKAFWRVLGINAEVGQR